MNAPLPPPKDQQEALPEIVLEKQPESVVREREGRLPPYTGLLIGVIILTLVAIGYAIYRDTHPDIIANPASGAAIGASKP